MKKIVLSTALSFLAGPSIAQYADSTYLDADYHETDNILSASYIRYGRKTPNYFEHKTFDLKTRCIDQIKRFTDWTCGEEHDTTFNFLDSNKLANFWVYNHGKLQGAYVKFWPNGYKKRIEIYDEDTMVIGHCYRENGEEVPYFPAEKMPEFPGGMNALYTFLVDNMKYPEKARKKGIEGRVRVQFTVMEDGSVTDFKINKSVDPLLDAEAIRVLSKMPKWIPGQQEGKNVQVRYALPISFSLE